MFGRLGLGSQDDCAVPTQVNLGEEKAVTTACGAYHTVVLTASGKLLAFGWNKHGRIGCKTPPPDTVGDSIVVPVAVNMAPLDGKVVCISAGENNTIALTDKGSAYTWGSGAWNSLGHGDEKEQSEPKLVEALQGKHAVLAAVGAAHMLVLTKTNELYSWGLNSSNQLGREESTGVLPARVTALDSKLTITDLACGKSHSACVAGGQLFTWGDGRRGLLGHGGEDATPTPKRIELLKDTIVQVECSWMHTAALTAEGKVFTFGSKDYGKLGYEK